MNGWTGKYYSKRNSTNVRLFIFLLRKGGRGGGGLLAFERPDPANLIRRCIKDVHGEWVRNIKIGRKISIRRIGFSDFRLDPRDRVL
jgi:hypothetical protein